MVPIFNPGSNYTRRSHLRLSNLANGARRYVLAAVDSEGKICAREIGPVAAHATRQWSAEALEGGSGGLGEGKGKWLLIVGGHPALVVHLLQSAYGGTAGQWSNLTALAPAASYYSETEIISLFRQAQALLEGS